MTVSAGLLPGVAPVAKIEREFLGLAKDGLLAVEVDLVERARGQHD